MNRQGLLITAQPGIVSRTVFKQMSGDENLLEILRSFHVDNGPLVASLSDVDKKGRKNKKKSRRRHRELPTLKPVDDSSNQKSQRIFKINSDVSHDTGKTLTEFTLFNELAPEIREMIWKEALPGPQAVKVTSNGVNDEDPPTLLSTTHRFTYRAKASYVPSALLAVNRESRAVVNCQYPLVFAAQLGGRPIRFSFSKDVLYFESPSAMVSFYGGTLPMFNTEIEKFGYFHDMKEVHDKVQHVAVGVIRAYKATVGATLNQYKELKTALLGTDIGDDMEDLYDTVMDYVTGDKRLNWGWERHQNFKTTEDGNMPEIERYRTDVFLKKLELDYMQDLASPQQKSFPPSVSKKPTEVPKKVLTLVAPGLRVNC
ncbi:hypothetical protein EG329_005739 [Mollisiaceae sp. DMI_Dod_QoI]|nr:hypothetical protein EG329_005739 [Helotiales sp. DMI_Dod_QoI]